MTKLGFRMIITETDEDHLTSHFARVLDMTVYHNVLKDMSTACGMQLVGVQSGSLKPVGKPRCSRCMKAVDAVTSPPRPTLSFEVA